jgi:recombination protein RecT
MTEQLAKPTEKPTVKSWLTSDTLKAQITQALPKHCTPERFMRVLFTSMQKTPKLMQCSQESLFAAFIACSQYGIEPDGRRAHLIPYGSQCQLIIDYKGLVELIMRSGLVSYIHADVVCENDEFVENMGKIESHKIDRKKERGKVYAAYAIAQLKDGPVKAEVMSFDEIESIRKRSKYGDSGPWQTDWNEMAKKTVFRRLSKWLPLSPEIQDAVMAGDDVIDFKPEPDIKIAEPVFNDAFGGES